MISHIAGKLLSRTESSIVLSAGAISYEVLLPGAVMKAIEEEGSFQEDVRLVTYHYYQMQHSSAVPVLIGFKNEIEKEFFEKFISVSGVGPKAACRALAEPFSAIAAAIDTGDLAFLKSLPGIGSQRARQIIAKLQGKVGKYCLIKDSPRRDSPAEQGFKDEALAVLLQLEYKRPEAERMLQDTISSHPEITDAEQLLNEVYKRNRRT